jgi:antitoxin VapB
LSAFDSTTNQVVNVFGSLTFRSIGDALPTGLDLILANHSRSKRRRLRDELREIAQRCARLPTIDDRSAEEILGYDERGLPR